MRCIFLLKAFSFFEITPMENQKMRCIFHDANYPAGIYLLKINYRNIRARREICSKLKTPERRFGVFNVNFKHISHLVLVFPLLTLNMQLSPG